MNISPSSNPSTNPSPPKSSMPMLNLEKDMKIKKWGNSKINKSKNK